MHIIAKNPQRSNIVFVFPQEAAAQLDAQQVYAAFSGDATRGSNFVDDPAMGLKVFSFPALQLKVVLEQNRFRVEDISGKPPEETKCALEAHRLVKSLFPQITPESYGFNYDLYFRFDNVIPQREILKSFLSEKTLETVKDFGWQFTLAKDNGRRQATYFFKVVAPIEMAVHVNFHYNERILPTAEQLQGEYQKNYEQADKVLADLAF